MKVLDIAAENYFLPECSGKDKSEMPRNEKVTEIIDGDTFKTASRKNSVRLAGVDAPEKGERGGAGATKALQDLIGGETVSIETVGRSYGRAVAKVKVGNRSVNNAMNKKMKKK